MPLIEQNRFYQSSQNCFAICYIMYLNHSQTRSKNIYNSVVVQYELELAKKNVTYRFYEVKMTIVT